uniref:Uncharacterized protein n=1 Tax=Oryza punctata TaxID=4537 RepID=A0A0E0LGQ5_ORYPU
MALLRAAARARVRLVGSGPPALATFAGADKATGSAAGERALQAMRLSFATPSIASVGGDVKSPVFPPAGAAVTLVEQATRFATATTALALAKIPAAGRSGGPRSAGILVAKVAVGSKGARFATSSAAERALLALERAQQATSPCPPPTAPRILCRGLSTVAGDKKARRFSSGSAGDDQSKSMEKKEGSRRADDPAAAVEEPLSRRARADDTVEEEEGSRRADDPAVEEPLEPLKEMEQSVLRVLEAMQKVIFRSFSEQEAFMEDLMKRASTQIIQAGVFYNANTTVGIFIAILLCFAIIMGVLLFMSVLFAEGRAKQFLHGEECDRLTDGVMDKAEQKTQEFLRSNNFHEIVEGLELVNGEEVRAIRKRFMKEALQDMEEYIVHKTTFGSQRDKVASWFRRDKQQELPSPSAALTQEESTVAVGVVEKVRMRDRVAAWFRRNKEETKPAEPAPPQQQ